jgi:hypothetical protein
LNNAKQPDLITPIIVEQLHFGLISNVQIMLKYLLSIPLIREYPDLIYAFGNRFFVFVLSNVMYFENGHVANL